MGTFALACLIIGLVGAGTVAATYAASDKYRQKMIDSNGYFDDKMKIGEFFTVSYFGNNETVETAMDLDYLISANKGQIKKGKDEIGTFLSYNDQGSAIRIYLPKDEWFRNEFNGTIKSFWDRESHYTENKNCFQLCFVLMDPTQAIASFQVDPQTRKLTYKLPNDSVTRGWEVLKVYKQTGYFSRQGNILQKKVSTLEQYERKSLNEVGLAGEGGYDNYYGSDEYVKSRFASAEKSRQDNELAELQQKIQEAQQGGGSGLSEYLYSNYGEEYAKNEFDVWYDSFHGQAIAIGTQILIGIGTGGLATAVVESMAGTYAASVAVRATIIIGSEIIVGVPEAVYLYNRGYTSIAAIIIICCFIPLVTEFKLGRMILRLPPSDERLIRSIINQAVDPETGKVIWTTPKQFRTWLKSLSEAEQKILAEQLSAVAAYYEKNGTRELIQQTTKGLSESLVKLRNIPRFNSPVQMYESWFQFGIITLQLKNTIIQAEKQAGKIVFTNYPTLKTLGFTIFGLMGPLMIGSVLLIGNNEELIKNPQKLFDGSEKALAYFRKEMRQTRLELETFIQGNNNQINLLFNNPTKENLKKALDLSYENYVVLKNLYLFTQTGWSDKDFTELQGKNQEKIAYKILASLQVSYSNSLINKYIEAENQGNKKAAEESFKEFERALQSPKVQNVEKLNKKGRSESCSSLKDVSALKKSIACIEKNIEFEYTKSDVDSFLNWIIGINVSGCTISDTTGNFSSFKQNFSTSRNLYKLNKSGGYDVETRTYTFGPNQSNTILQSVIYFCKDSNKSSITSEFYQLCIIRSLFTQFFDEWAKKEKNVCSTTVGDLNNNTIKGLVPSTGSLDKSISKVVKKPTDNIT